MAAATVALPAAIDQTEAVNPWLIAFTVTPATFMELLDTAIANVSLPPHCRRSRMVTAVTGSCEADHRSKSNRT